MVGRAVAGGVVTEVGTVTLVIGTVVRKVVLGNVESGVVKVVAGIGISSTDVVGLVSILPRAARSSESVRAGSAITPVIETSTSAATTTASRLSSDGGSEAS